MTGFRTFQTATSYVFIYFLIQMKSKNQNKFIESKIVKFIKLCRNFMQL